MSLSKGSWSEEGSSVESLVRLQSPDATTISSGPSTESLKSSLGGELGPLSNGHAEFVALQRELARFVSKNRAHRTNVIRLSLLPFLRRRSCEILPVDGELQFRVCVLGNWWLQLLEDLRSNIVSGADRGAYYETISGLLCRPEWKPDPYDSLLVQTLDVVMPKVALPNLSPGLAAFAGKLLAYAFLHIPHVADCLLYNLKVHQGAVDRLKGYVPSSYTGRVPEHLHHLVGRTTVVDKPSVSPFKVECASWVRNWTPDSPMFVSFLKHYYSLLADSLGEDLDTHFAAPGLLLIHTSILQYLGAVVERKDMNQPPPSIPGSPASSPSGSPSSSPPNSPPRAQSPPRRPRVVAPRVDKLRVFGALREILHNDEATVPFFQPFALQFDRLIQAVASSVNVYTMNSCVKMCDLIEEWLSCVVIEHRRSLHQVTAMLSKAVDWEFWIHVASRMLSSENCHSEIRAISLLFNIWPHIPQHKPCDPNRLLRTRCRVAVYVPRSPMLLWDFTQWLLSPAVWDAYFCHWSPLVRSYYLRLIVFRVVNVGNNAVEWIADYSQSRYHQMSAKLVQQRLDATYTRCMALARDSSMQPCVAASLPLPNRRVTIGVNAAATAQDAAQIYMFDIFDNSAYYSDQRALISDSNSTCSRDSDASSIASMASGLSGLSVATSGNGVGSVDLMRRSSSLTSMPSINENEMHKSRSESKLATAPPKRWSLLRKLIPGNTTPSASKTREQKPPKKKNFKFADPSNIPSPWQLNEPRPEVQRPLYRFKFGPVPEPTVRIGISRPFLPFEEEFYIDERAQQPLRSHRNDLSYWNYGCRALTEWNETASMFEEYVERKLGFQAADKVAMPFMVAEIPWRAIG